MNKLLIGDWIYIGNTSRENGVICNILEENKKMEIVYLDNMNRPINEDVIFLDGYWIFEKSNPCGGYAEKNERLKKYVSILKKGRY